MFVQNLCLESYGKEPYVDMSPSLRGVITLTPHPRQI